MALSSPTSLVPNVCTNMADLLVDNVTKDFPTRGEPLRVLREVSLELNQGGNLAILGPSGSGKSTLLHILGTLDQPTSGQVRIGGNDPFQLDAPQLADFRGRRIGFIFQEHYLLPQLSALENLLVPVLAVGRAGQADVKRGRMLLERVGLADRLDHRPAELSGGERQRVAVARALMREPELLLADEPTGNLDRTNAVSVAEILLNVISPENKMLIVVTHSMELASMLNRQMELIDGRLE